MVLISMIAWLLAILFGKPQNKKCVSVIYAVLWHKNILFPNY